MAGGKAMPGARSWQGFWGSNELVSLWQVGRGVAEAGTAGAF